MTKAEKPESTAQSGKSVPSQARRVLHGFAQQNIYKLDANLQNSPGVGKIKREETVAVELQREKKKKKKKKAMISASRGRLAML